MMVDAKNGCLPRRSLQTKIAFNVQVELRVVLVFLTFGLSPACLAQNNPPARDPVQLEAAQAMREGRLTDAEKLLTDAIRELEQSDPQNPKLATYLKRLAGVVGSRGRRAEALALMQRAYEIDRNAYGPTGLQISDDLLRQGMDAQTAGDNQQAEHLYKQALEIVRMNRANLKTAGDVGLAAMVLDRLSYLYTTEHRWFDAEPLLKDEAKLREFFQEPYRAGYAGCGHIGERLAEIYRAEGRTVDAEHVPPDPVGPPELDALNRTAEKYTQDGLYASAEETYSHAIALAQKMEADPKTLYGGLIVREMNSLGQLYDKEGFQDRAEKTYEGALEMDEKLAGPERGHTGYAERLNPWLLVNLYRSEGRLKDAEPLLRRVLEIQERSLGERHRAVILTLTRLASIYEEEGNCAVLAAR
jgi:tetratricopeptide (TPR) repeat protein